MILYIEFYNGDVKIYEDAEQENTTEAEADAVSMLKNIDNVKAIYNGLCNYGVFSCIYKKD